MGLLFKGHLNWFVKLVDDISDGHNLFMIGEWADKCQMLFHIKVSGHCIFMSHQLWDPLPVWFRFIIAIPSRHMTKTWQKSSMGFYAYPFIWNTTTLTFSHVCNKNHHTTHRLWTLVKNNPGFISQQYFPVPKCISWLVVWVWILQKTEFLTLKSDSLAFSILVSEKGLDLPE